MILLSRVVSALFTKRCGEEPVAPHASIDRTAEADHLLSLILETRKVTEDDCAGYDRVARRILTSLGEPVDEPPASRASVEAECERLKARILSTRKVSAEDREHQRSVARRILASLGEPV